jgi:hypothetical protein
MFRVLECTQRLIYVDSDGNEVIFQPVTEALVLITVNNRFSWRTTIAVDLHLQKKFSSQRRDVYIHEYNKYLADNLRNLAVSYSKQWRNIYCRLSFEVSYKLYNCSQIMTVSDLPVPEN